MYSALLWLLIVGYIFSMCISVITLIYIVRHHKDYGMMKNLILHIITIIMIGIFYSSFYVISIVISFTNIVNLLLWKISVILGFLSCMIILLNYSFIVNNNKIKSLPVLYLTMLFGILIGTIFCLDSIQIIHTSSNSPNYLVSDTLDINYIFSSDAIFIIIFFLISIITFFLYITLLIYFQARKSSLSQIVFIYTLFIPILMYILYVTFQQPVFRELHIIFIWVSLTCACIMLIKKPELFLILTNKIYFLNLYHKSGILLYSYKFEKINDMKDSNIWGNILIGINHILSEFIDKSDQIDVMQTQNVDIIVNYDNKYGFATLVITNQKNSILENYIKNFMNEFKERYENELNDIQDLNKIINVSEFEDTKDIIERNFKFFIS